MPAASELEARSPTPQYTALEQQGRQTLLSSTAPTSSLAWSRRAITAGAAGFALLVVVGTCAVGSPLRVSSFGKGDVEEAWSIWDIFPMGSPATSTETSTSTTPPPTTTTTTLKPTTTTPKPTTSTPKPTTTTTTKTTKMSTATKAPTSTPAPTTVTTGTTMTSLRGTNPYAYPVWYVNPSDVKKYKPSIDSSEGRVQETLRKMSNVPTATWITEKKFLFGKNDTGTLEGVLYDASQKGFPELVTLILYNLPNRDCDAKASVGEICCTKNKDGSCDFDKISDCSDGITEYMTEFVDPFIKLLQEYEGRVPVVVVVEPDSLPNLATNLEHPHCGNEATQNAYKKGVKYVVEQLVKKTGATIYIDGANGAWIGWANHMETFMGILKNMSLPMNQVRGFTSNVAKYQPLGEMCPWEPDEGYRNAHCLNDANPDDACCADPCKLLGQWNSGQNELNFVHGMSKVAKGVLDMDAHFMIDTSRNGVEDMGVLFSNWCNLRGAGAGIAASIETAKPELIDAYFWVKCPGESDGCTEELPDGGKCGWRFDPQCKSDDSVGSLSGEPRAPEAGKWFDYQVKQLAEKGRSAIGDSPKIHGQRRQ